MTGFTGLAEDLAVLGAGLAVLGAGLAAFAAGLAAYAAGLATDLAGLAFAAGLDLDFDFDVFAADTHPPMRREIRRSRFSTVNPSCLSIQGSN